MPETWLGENRQTLATDAHHQLPAPVVLWGCLGALSNKKDPIATLAEVRVDAVAHTTYWALAWITSEDLIFVTASKDRTDWSAWDADAEEGEPDGLEAWSRPLSSIASVELTRASAKRAKVAGSDHWLWVGRYRMTFEDGTKLSLPLLQQTENAKSDADVTMFVEVLKARTR